MRGLFLRTEQSLALEFVDEELRKLLDEREELRETASSTIASLEGAQFQAKDGHTEIVYKLSQGVYISLIDDQMLPALSSRFVRLYANMLRLLFGPNRCNFSLLQKRKGQLEGLYNVLRDHCTTDGVILTGAVEAQWHQALFRDFEDPIHKFFASQSQGWGDVVIVFRGSTVITVQARGGQELSAEDQFLITIFLKWTMATTLQPTDSTPSPYQSPYPSPSPFTASDVSADVEEDPQSSTSTSDYQDARGDPAGSQPANSPTQMRSFHSTTVHLTMGDKTAKPYILHLYPLQSSVEPPMTVVVLGQPRFLKVYLNAMRFCEVAASLRKPAEAMVNVNYVRSPPESIYVSGVAVDWYVDAINGVYDQGEGIVNDHPVYFERTQKAACIFFHAEHNAWVFAETVDEGIIAICQDDVPSPDLARSAWTCLTIDGHDVGAPIHMVAVSAFGKFRNGNGKWATRAGSRFYCGLPRDGASPCICLLCDGRHSPAGKGLCGGVDFKGCACTACRELSLHFGRHLAWVQGESATTATGVLSSAFTKLGETFGHIVSQLKENSELKQLTQAKWQQYAERLQATGRGVPGWMVKLAVSKVLQKLAACEVETPEQYTRTVQPAMTFMLNQIEDALHQVEVAVLDGLLDHFSRPDYFQLYEDSEQFEALMRLQADLARSADEKADMFAASLSFFQIEALAIPGLIHYAAIDRSANRLLMPPLTLTSCNHIHCPPMGCALASKHMQATQDDVDVDVNQMYIGAEFIEGFQDQFWNFYFKAQERLALGYTTYVYQEGDIRFSYFAMFVSPDMIHMPPGQARITEFSSALRDTEHSSSQAHQALTEVLFSQRTVQMLELYLATLAIVPAEVVADFARRHLDEMFLRNDLFKSPTHSL
eukprot:m.250646 g.250646  ORF g.250646 m.250646 type:complete len:882 (-) comp15441_c1_seq7:1596-4241(-)